MKNACILNPTASTKSIADALYEKTTQAKAMIECILLAILSKELKNNLLFDAVGAQVNWPLIWVL